MEASLEVRAQAKARVVSIVASPGTLHENAPSPKGFSKAKARGNSMGRLKE